MSRISIFLFLIVFDLLSKKFVYDLVDLHAFIPITFFLDLTHIHNFGVSFGLFAGLISPWILVILGLFIVIFMYFLMLSSKDLLEKLGFLVIISGAISNIIDRILSGYVIDFIYFHYKDFYWPAFNFADIYISIGIIMILLNLLKKI